MKNILSALCLLALFTTTAIAAPYHLDAPIASYTWGESMKTAWDTRNDDDNWQKVSNDGLLILRKDKPSLLLRFWRDRLVMISENHPASGITPEQAAAIYRNHQEDFTEKWGQPSPPKPCAGNPVACQEVVWQPEGATQIRLYRNTPASDRAFVGYAYADRETYPKYAAEIEKYGVKYPVYAIQRLYRDKPDHAEKTLKDKRVRIDGRIVSVSPLILDQKGQTITCTLKNAKEAKNLKRQQMITVSGIIDGITDDDNVLLKDSIVAPAPEGEQIRVLRGGKKPGGFFPAESFYQRLEMAANQVEKGFSIRDFTAAPRIEDRRVVVDFIASEMPGKMFFSLEPLHADQSGDTIAFNMHQEEGERQPNGYFIMAVFSIILKASQPDVPLDNLWGQVEDTIKKQARDADNGGTAVINGWTYRLERKGETGLIFSATAPGHRR